MLILHSPQHLPYEILQAHHLAEPKIIQAAFRKLAQKYHPDKEKDEDKRRVANERMKEINEAYEVLSNPEKRRAYDIEWLKHQQEISQKGPSHGSESPKKPVQEDRKQSVKRAPTWEYKKPTFPPFTVIEETDKYKVETCPDCHQDTLIYFKPATSRDKGEYRCSNEPYYPHPYLDKYLKDNP